MTGKVIWITGLSGAGKTTVAKELNIRLKNNHIDPIVLDGDILRKIFAANTPEEQSYSRNSRLNLGLKYGLLCKILSKQGFTVIVATIAMFDEVYSWNRENLENYLEIYLKVPLDELCSRDKKKIYQRYKNGELNNVAGLDLAVDEPLSADIIYDFASQPFLWENPSNLINNLMEDLEKKSFLFSNKIRSKIGKKE